MKVWDSSTSGELQATRSLRFPDISVLFSACYIRSLSFYDANNSHLHFPCSVEKSRTIPNSLAAFCNQFIFRGVRLLGPRRIPTLADGPICCPRMLLRHIRICLPCL